MRCSVNAELIFGLPTNRLPARRVADGLLRYSERGQDYVDEIQQMIRGNGLDQGADGIES